jgi:hypothetical protein
MCSGAIASAETFSWTDDAGGLHFTDQYYNVPQKYQGKINIRADINQEPSSYITESPKPKQKKNKGSQYSSKQKNNRNSSTDSAVNHSQVPVVSGTNSPEINHDRRNESERYRRTIHTDTRRSQKEAYDSQSEARKATISAERQINNAANVGQQSINSAQQAQQKAQDMINKGRNTSTIQAIPNAQQSAQDSINKARNSGANHP